MNTLSQHSAQRVGFAGLLPFIGLALLALLDIYTAEVLIIFMVYSALTLSFVGGISWGLSMAASESDNSRSLQWSALPTFAGLILVIVATLPCGQTAVLPLLSVLALLHLFWLNYERRKLTEHTWYIELRSRLTFTAVALHIILIIINIS